jgi:ATP-binding cassette, subfamily B, bacterial PglK
LYGAYTNIKGSYVSLKDVLILLEQPLPKNITLSDGDSISFERGIKLKNISFHYAGTEEEIVKGVNINITKGSKIGLVGSTGSGKSTVIDIIMGLLSPTSGQIFIDNVEISKSNQHLWRNHIAHVPQHIFLSDGTIEENIALGISKDQINQNKIKEAASQAQLDKLIDSWPDKYQTMVGERGIRLSGGQRQRIGIARAIYKKAQVLIFDEATSALDNNTEREIVRQIERLKGEKTIIVIAHRYSTLQHCDTIYKLSNGKIINIGGYKDLIANN